MWKYIQAIVSVLCLALLLIIFTRFVMYIFSGTVDHKDVALYIFGLFILLIVHLATALDKKESEPLRYRIVSAEIWINTAWVTQYFIDRETNVKEYYVLFCYKDVTAYPSKHYDLRNNSYKTEADAMKELNNILIRLKKLKTDKDNCVRNISVIKEVVVSDELKNLEI